MKYLRDGSILFSRSESLPKQLPGYQPDPGDPYHWNPEPLPCKHRERRIIELPCKNCRVAYHCHFFKQDVTLASCNDCDEESGLEPTV